MTTKKTRIGIIGVGTIGKEILKRSIEHPEILIVGVADTSGVIFDSKGFGNGDIKSILEHKKDDKQLKELKNYDYLPESLDLISILPDILVDVTASQTYKILYDAVKVTNVISSNKIPFSDTSMNDFKSIFQRAKENNKIIDIGTTVGAGLQFPNLMKLFPDGVRRMTGCFSGTMNYLSQRINEGSPLSQALKEAMSPPRNYAEPDPRIDLFGKDFSRKLVILARINGSTVGLENVQIKSLISNDLEKVSLEKFFQELPSYDSKIQSIVENANGQGNALWYLGNANFIDEKYTIGFQQVPLTDNVVSSKESENVVQIFPRKWRSPCTIIGPGAGPPETVSGILSGIKLISERDQR